MEKDIKMAEITPLFGDNDASTGQTLEAWVQGKADQWRTHYEQVYQKKFREYYRIWRGEHSSEDSTSSVEKSKIIPPGSMQAVEENTAEVEEATFTGRMFDLRDDEDDPEHLDIAKLRRLLDADLKKAKVQPAVSECILNAAVYGTGIGELVIDTVLDQKPAVQDAAGGSLKQVGVEITERVQVK